MTTSGSRLLLGQHLRRDRTLVAVWVLLLAGVCGASAGATVGLYPTAADRVHAASVINASPAIVALYGPVVDPRSLGELAMTKMTVLYAVLVAMLVVVLVRRHTRVEEESGRAELVGGTAVGRDAPMVAGVGEGALVAVVTGVLAAIADIVAGLPATGSIAFGASWAGTGIVAAGLAAVACQLAASARTCAAYAAGALGAAYLLRAVGDTTVPWLGWVSPFGWNTRLHAWTDPRWWVLLLYVATFALLVGAAVALRGRRDLGAGLIAARPGPTTAASTLGSPLGLVVRQQMAALVTWSVGVAVAGGLFGYVVPGMGELLDSPQAQRMLEGLGGALVAAVLAVLAVVVSCFGIAVVVHAGTDEASGRTDLVLATGASRARWLSAVLLVALAGDAWLLLVSGATLAAGYAAAGGSDPGAIVGAALAWLPATWVVAGLAAALLAVGSRWAAAGWGWPAAFLTLMLVGDLWELPGWLTGLSPYAHVPLLPAEPWRPVPETGLLAVAGATLLGAWIRLRRRDIG